MMSLTLPDKGIKTEFSFISRERCSGIGANTALKSHMTNNSLSSRTNLYKLVFPELTALMELVTSNIWSVIRQSEVHACVWPDLSNAP